MATPISPAMAGPSPPSSGGPCGPSRPAGRRPSEATRCSATTVTTPRWPITPVATGIAPSARGAPKRRGWPPVKRRLLDVPYFHVVFTLPHTLSPVVLQNPRPLYTCLFQAVAETLLTVARDPRHLGADLGFLAVLHTWGQTLHHHPHLHCVVPGGGLSPDRTQWLACRPTFFLPVRVLSRVFRRLFLTRLCQSHAEGRLTFTGHCHTLAAPQPWQQFLASLQDARLGRLCQPPFWWPCAGPQISGPLHASCGDHESSPASVRRRAGDLPVERLRAGKPPADDDPRRRRVSPALSSACAPHRLPPDPALWLAGQSGAARDDRPLSYLTPAAPRGPTARAAGPAA